MTSLRPVDNFEEHVPPPDYAAPRNGRNGTTPLTHRHEHRDDEAERCLISAALNQPGVVQAVADTGLAAEHFVGGNHAAVWSAIIELDAEGVRPDVVVVRDRANAEHQQIDDAELVALQTTPLAYLSNAAKYAHIVVANATARRARAELAEASERIRLGADPHTVIAALADTLPRPATTTEGIAADMQAVLDGEAEMIVPNLAPRDDHATCLLYAPGINWLDGEPGRGKTMVAMWWAYRELDAGRHVVYIQFEGEGNKHQFGARLKQMGLRDASRLHYVHRAGPWSPTDLAELRGIFTEHQPSLVVVDSVASAMQAEGLDPESNKDVEAWKACIPSWATQCGAAFLAVDHLTKNPEARGRYSIGAQRKLGITDVAYRLLMHQEAGLGRTGYGRLEVMKDREGALAAFQEGRVVAEVSVASEQKGDTYSLRVGLAPPASVDSPGSGPTWYMEHVSDELADHGPLTKSQLRIRIGKRKDLVDNAIERLLDEGAIRPVDVKGNVKPYESVYRWRTPAPPVTPSFYETDHDDEDPF